MLIVAMVMTDLNLLVTRMIRVWYNTNITMATISVSPTACMTIPG